MKRREKVQLRFKLSKTSFGNQKNSFDMEILGIPLWYFPIVLRLDDGMEIIVFFIKRIIYAMQI